MRVNPNFRKAQNEARLLQMQRAKTAKRTARGSTYSEGATGTAVIYCPTCSAPVVDSVEGRKRHFQNTRCLGVSFP